MIVFPFENIEETSIHIFLKGGGGVKSDIKQFSFKTVIVILFV